MSEKKTNLKTKNLELIQWAEKNQFSFIPVIKKKPLFSWKHLQERKPSREEIENWKLFDFNRIGVICGKISGRDDLSLEVIDVDAPEYFEFFKDIETRIHKTPGGGYHLLFYSKTENERTPKYRGFPIDLLGKKGFFIFGEDYKVIKNKPILIIEDTKKLLDSRLPRVDKSWYPKRDDDFEKRIEKFKNQIDIEKILLHYGAKNLRRIGHYTVCRCPFDEGQHEYNSIINRDTYYCFTENKLRDVISIVQEKEKCNFWEAIEKLEKLTGVKFEREEKREEFPELLSAFLENHINYLKIAKIFSEKYPIVYDKNHLFWFWNGHCYEMIDETDLLKIVNDISLFDGVINSKIKSQLLEAFRIEGRRRLEKLKKPRKDWIVFLNGIFDLSTGEILKPSPEYFITSVIPHNIPESDSEETPTIDKLFKEWYPQNTELLYEICAYAMLDDYPIHRIFVLFGRGRNGKGTFIRFLKNLIGYKNCCSTDLYRLINSRFETARLYKKKLALLGETDYKSIERSDIIKSLSGQDPIPAEFKNKPNFDFENYAKIVIATNSLPPTRDRTLGFYSRWIILKFEKVFNTNRDVLKDIPEWEYENMCKKCVKILKNLLEKREFSGEGSYEDKERLYEELSNPILIFLKERVEKDVDSYIPKFEFKEQLEIFCRERGFRVMNDKEITKIMRDYGYEDKLKKVEVDGEKKVWRCWFGLKWKTKKVSSILEIEFPISIEGVLSEDEIFEPPLVPMEISIGEEEEISLENFLEIIKKELEELNFLSFKNLNSSQQLELLKYIIRDLKKENKEINIETLREIWNKLKKFFNLSEIDEYLDFLNKEGILYEKSPGIFDFV